MVVFRDFGVYYDEKLQIIIGATNYQYINQGDQSLLTYQDRYYGPFFELPLLVLFNNIPNPGMIHFRHFTIFLIFYIGLIGFYFLSRRLFNNHWWALLSVALFVTSPRIFADSFYNSKDIPFMVLFQFGILSLIHLLDLLEKGQLLRQEWMALILHAIICAALIATRVPGIALVVISVCLIVIKLFVMSFKFKYKVWFITSYFLITLGFTILFWPILWHDPLRELVNAINQMSHGNLWARSILFQGKFIQANNPVLYYLPVWIAVTTPYLPLGLFGLGSLCLFTSAFNGLSTNYKSTLRKTIGNLSSDCLDWVAVAAWLMIPITAIIVLRSVLYDAWRQMFFIYPAFLLIGVFGLKKLFSWVINHSKNKKFTVVIFCLILVFGILNSVVSMVRIHPFENVYFNSLAGDPRTLRHRYEMDYWGLSYKQGIDYIIAHDSRDIIKLHAENPGQLYVEYMLPHYLASRIIFVDLDEADYFLTNYRWHPDDFPFQDVYFSINVNGSDIMTVYRLR